MGEDVIDRSCAHCKGEHTADREWLKYAPKLKVWLCQHCRLRIDKDSPSA